jgi:hypothetical protein
MLADVAGHQAVCAARWTQARPPHPLPLGLHRDHADYRHTPRRIDSQYLLALLGSKKEFFDGARSYTVKLPPEILEARFWSRMLHDN